MSIFTRAAGPFVIPDINQSERQTSQGRQNNQSSFVTAKVIDFISDPKSLSQSKVDLLKASVTNSSLINTMPINSIWCQIIEANRLDQHIAYPFFPAHLCFPIKPTEQVWIFYSSLDQVYYWMCRKTGDYISEDVNFTHVDRIVNAPVTQGSPGIEPQISSKAAYNGTITEVSFPQGKTDSVYEKTSGAFFDDSAIIKQSQEYQENFIQEAVPRLVRQPGDLVMQGSNNTAIVLGSSENIEGKGTIDIVTGRFLKNNSVTNTRGFKEVDKTRTALSDGQTDFINDDARVYLGMNEDADTNFQVNIEGIPGSGTSSCTVVKGNHVRLLGAGNVKITSQASGASVVLQETGDVVVVPGSGGKVYLAGTESDQAYLRYDEFNTIVNDLLTIIQNLQDSLGPAVIAATDIRSSAENSAEAAAITANLIPGTVVYEQFVKIFVDNALNVAVGNINSTRFSTISSNRSDVIQKLQSIKSQKILGT